MSRAEEKELDRYIKAAISYAASTRTPIKIDTEDAKLAFSQGKSPKEYIDEKAKN